LINIICNINISRAIILDDFVEQNIFRVDFLTNKVGLHTICIRLYFYFQNALLYLLMNDYNEAKNYHKENVMSTYTFEHVGNEHTMLQAFALSLRPRALTLYYS